ncbi:RNA-dependent RNA polymerase [Callinectes sapidus toti-like virus 1]|nr:RNA-dependent RNA polymerase [Callinectes sapidus toti-like virus 1]
MVDVLKEIESWEAEMCVLGGGIPLGSHALKTFFCCSIASAEDYRAMRLAVRLPTGPGNVKSMRGVVSPESMKEWFGESLVPKGSIALTLTTVYTVLRRDPTLWERELIGANRNGQQWSAAAMILGLNCLRAPLLAAIVRAGWQRIPLPDWTTVLSDCVVALRRCPFVEGCGWEEPDGYSLRKLLSCTNRTLDEADWSKELTNIQRDLPVHYWVDEYGCRSRALWQPKIVKIMREVLERVVNQTLNGPPLESMESWWSSRWAWAPGGSTSQRHVLKDAISADERLTQDDRAGKKAVFENLDDDWVQRVLCDPPAVVGRASTKHEPGAKNRALYAEGDESFCVSAYASLNFEKFMNVGGMVGKQTPADVCDWLYASNMSKLSNPYWLSADYSDFNKGHEAEDMWLLDMMVARAWAATNSNPLVRRDKVRCARWTAGSHQVKWARIEGRMERVFSGLFSGSRNTARDNTILHKVYSEAILCAMRDAGWKGEVGYQAYCGDDEDMEFDNWRSVLYYYVMHSLSGHELKPPKQLAGKTHEFLQRMVIPGEHTIRPLFAMLAQAASGNWYNDTYTWYGNSIPAVRDMCWEMHVRGMPLEWARRLCIETLNATMRVPLGNKEWRKLEWWSYRNGGDVVHPMWNGLGIDSGTQPRLTPKTVPVQEVPQKASNAWVAKVEKLTGKIGTDRRLEIIRECSADSYSKLYVHTRLVKQREEVMEMWPERTSEIPVGALHVGLITAPPLRRILQGIVAEPTDRRPVSSDAVAARFGVNEKIVLACGGWQEFLRLVPPEMVGNYEEPVTSYTIPLCYYKMDSALVSWARVNRCLQYEPDRRAEANRVWAETVGRGIKGRHIIWWLVPNAGGKTTYSRKQNLIGRQCIDIDDLLIEYPGMRNTLRSVRKGHGDGGQKDILADLIAGVVQKNSADEVLWQGDASWVIGRLRKHGWDVDLRIADIDEEEVVKRLRCRWWRDERIEKRRLEWLVNVNKALSQGAVVCPLA